MGTEYLTLEQQSRLSLLCTVVGSLRNEVNRLDEIVHGEVYDGDEGQ